MHRKSILHSHGNFPECSWFIFQRLILQSFHQLPSSRPSIPGSSLADETSGVTTIFGKCMIRARSLFTCTISRAYKKLNTARNVLSTLDSCCIRQFGERICSLQSPRCLFYQDFVCFCQPCIAFGKFRSCELSSC